MDSPTPSLKWPAAPLQTRQPDKGKMEVLCLARKKWLVLEPEEWVRQHVIHHLNAVLGYPLGCMSVEHQLTLNGRELLHGSLKFIKRTAAPPFGIYYLFGGILSLI